MDSVESKVGDNTTSALALRGVQAWFQLGLERGNSALEVDRIVVFAGESRGAQPVRHRDQSGASWSEWLLGPESAGKGRSQIPRMR
jgi:hypothetical protein